MLVIARACGVQSQMTVVAPAIKLKHAVVLMHIAQWRTALAASSLAASAATSTNLYSSALSSSALELSV
eukprot:6777-Heterococcus_DN1.PRE.1